MPTPIITFSFRFSHHICLSSSMVFLRNWRPLSLRSSARWSSVPSFSPLSVTFSTLSFNVSATATTSAWSATIFVAAISHAQRFLSSTAIQKFDITHRSSGSLKSINTLLTQDQDSWVREGKGHSLPRVASTGATRVKGLHPEGFFRQPRQSEAGYWLFKITLSSDRSNPLTPIEQEMK